MQIFKHMRSILIKFYEVRSIKQESTAVLREHAQYNGRYCNWKQLFQHILDRTIERKVSSQPDIISASNDTLLLTIYASICEKT